MNPMYDILTTGLAITGIIALITISIISKKLEAAYMIVGLQEAALEQKDEKIVELQNRVGKYEKRIFGLKDALNKIGTNTAIEALEYDRSKNG